MPTKQTVRIFIASAGEVKEERQKAILSINHLNKSHQHLDLEPIEWEYDIVKGNNPGFANIQDAINPDLKKSDIIVFVFHSCIRPNTRIEFNFASENNKKIFTFFRDGFSPKNKAEHTAYGELLDFKDGLSNTILKNPYNTVEAFEDDLYQQLNQYLYENYSEKNTGSISAEISTLIRLLSEKEDKIKQLEQGQGMLPNAGVLKELELLKQEKDDIRNQLQQSDEIIKQQAKDKEALEKQLALQNNNELKAQALAAVEEKDYDKAEELLIQSAKDSFNKAATTFYELAKIKRLKFKYHEALSSYEMAIRLDPKNSMYLSEAGAMAENVGFYDKAIEFFGRALEIYKETLGEEHEDMIVYYGELGLAYDGNGEYDKAIELYEKALGLSIKHYGEKHPLVSTQYNNIGASYSNKHQFEKAIGYFEKALAISVEHYGEIHPVVSNQYNNLGYTYDSLGTYDKAIEYLEKSISINLKYYGKEDAQMSTAYNNLGEVYRKKGENDEAIANYMKALAIDKQFNGEEHPNIAFDYNNLGLAYLNKKQYDDSIKHIEDALSIFEKFLPPEHVHIKTVKENLAEIRATVAKQAAKKEN